MANFMGGSAPAMASQIAEGYILLSPNTLRGYLPGELASLRVELEKLQRDGKNVVKLDLWTTNHRKQITATAMAEVILPA